VDKDVMPEPLPRLYTDLATWFHLLTAPDEYAEEAELYRGILCETTPVPLRTLLELGSGGGNIASYHKRHFSCTLVDLSSQMLEVSRSINPECEHIEGDMRTVRLGRTFDAVFVHDAVMYLTTEVDLRQAMETAFFHCRPGGVTLFVPDHVRETFTPTTDHGGHDGDGRGLRYLEWTWDPDPFDSTYFVDLAYLLREDGKPMRCEYDRHVCGLFGRDDWLRLLREVGFRAGVRPPAPGGPRSGWAEAFVAVKPFVSWG
jgi:hypothetical protein